MTDTSKVVAWRYRFEQKEGEYGKWTVQKNLPSWYHDGMVDVQLQPLVVMEHVAAKLTDGSE